MLYAIKRKPSLSSGVAGMEWHAAKLLIFFSFLALGHCELSNNTLNTLKRASETQEHFQDLNKHSANIKNSEHLTEYSNDVAEFKNVMLEYIGDVLNRDEINIMPGVYIQKKADNSSVDKVESKSLEGNLISTVRSFTETHVLRVELARAMSETGRLFFFKGLKKFMWPLFIGLQVVKTVLLVLFLPSIIGSVGKIVGKGLPSLSGTISQFSQPGANVESIDDLEFKDNSHNSDHDSDGTLNGAYQYNIPDSKSNSFVSQMYESAQTNNALSRLGFDKVTLAESNNNNRNNGFLSKRDDFKVFHDIPSSSLLLTNYDPFYSPLLSRLDAVFQQLGLDSAKDEKCREKLVCLMYSNPAKYAPYSNLVSAQLSRELNELKKPTSDNPDILRFFRYMRSAKDGQDGIDCELSYKECSTFNDMSGPAMINTFNDINKLVQARKLL